jgi:hypothetical protein
MAFKPCNEYYWLMYNIISKPSSLINQKSVFISCILIIFSFHWNSTGYGLPSTPTTGCIASWATDKAKPDSNWRKRIVSQLLLKVKKDHPEQHLLRGALTEIANLHNIHTKDTIRRIWARACQLPKSRGWFCVWCTFPEKEVGKESEMEAWWG